MNTPQTEPSKPPTPGLLKSDAEAAAALERADAKELHALYVKAVEKSNRTIKALSAVAEHYIGSKDSPRYEPTSSAIESMERVALAAISLAKSVADSHCHAPEDGAR